MLKRQVKYIHGEGAQRELEVQYAEVNHFKDNFALMATVCNGVLGNVENAS